jgi:hypothetical protein
VCVSGANSVGQRVHTLWPEDMFTDLVQKYRVLLVTWISMAENNVGENKMRHTVRQNFDCKEIVMRRESCESYQQEIARAHLPERLSTWNKPLTSYALQTRMLAAKTSRPANDATEVSSHWRLNDA